MKSGLVRVTVTDSIQADLVCHIENNKLVKIFNHRKELRINTRIQQVFFKDKWCRYSYFETDDRKIPPIDLPTIK